MLTDYRDVKSDATVRGGWLKYTVKAVLKSLFFSD